MENLNLDKFDPKKVEITALVDKCKDLEINGIDDKDGYKAVHEARMTLQKTRTGITKQAKEMRAEAIAFQNGVIGLEKDLIALIEPTETDLKSKQKAIDEKIEVEKRKALLPERREKLKDISIVCSEKYSDDYILKLDSPTFQGVLNAEMAEKANVDRIALEADKQKLQADKQKLEDAQNQLENDKRVQEAKEQAEADAKAQAEVDAKLAKEKAELDAKLAKEKAELDAKLAKEKAESDAKLAKAKAEHDAKVEAARFETEKQDAIAEEKRKAKEEADAREKADADIKAKKEQEEKDRLAEEGLQKFLSDNGYTEENKNDFIISDTSSEGSGTEITLFKKVAEYIINNK